MPAYLDIGIALISLELVLANVGHQESDLLRYVCISKFDIDFETFQEAFQLPELGGPFRQF
jgi:hypothetical protein